MGSLFKSPVVRIMLGAVISTYIAPKIINKFTRPELNEADARINMQTAIGITATTTTFTYVALGMLSGETVAKAASPGV